MRRGGRFIYVTDVSDPTIPKLLWKKSNVDTGCGGLGYTWSASFVTQLNIDVTNGSISTDDDDDTGVEADVLIFGAGYDPDVVNISPGKITDFTSSSVTTGHGTTNRTMSRGCPLR